MSTGVLLITLSAGCSSGSKPTPAPASSGSPTVAATQPITQPTVGSGPVVTLTSKEGYVCKLQASPYTGPAITVLQYTNGGGTGNAPPGKVFAAVAVTISDGLPDRGEPLDLLLGNLVDGLTFAVPTSSAAAFDMSAQVDFSNSNNCSHFLQPSTMWCELFTELTGPVPGQPGGLGPSAAGSSQLQPGQPVGLLLATHDPVPQTAPMAKLTLFAKLPGGNAVQVPVSTSG